MRTKKIDRGSRDWYQLQRWRKRAKYQLQTHPFCRFCRAQGRVTMATVADHDPPHGGDWNAFRLGPLQSLCASCHSKTKQIIECKGFSAECDEAGRPIDPNHPAYAQQGGVTSIGHRGLDRPVGLKREHPAHGK